MKTEDINRLVNNKKTDDNSSLTIQRQIWRKIIGTLRNHIENKNPNNFYKKILGNFEVLKAWAW